MTGIQKTPPIPRRRTPRLPESLTRTGERPHSTDWRPRAGIPTPDAKSAFHPPKATRMRSACFFHEGQLRGSLESSDGWGTRMVYVQLAGEIFWRGARRADNWD